MYFSLSTIALYATILCQVAVVVPAPLNAKPVTALRRAKVQTKIPIATSIGSTVVRSATASSTDAAATSTDDGGDETATETADTADPTATDSGVGGDNSTTTGGGDTGNSTTGGGGSGTGGPRFVIYTDKTVAGSKNGLPAPADLKGYNTLMLGFLLPNTTAGKNALPADQSAVWAKLGAAAQKSLKATYTAAGVKVMVSAFGGTSLPTTEGFDPAKTASDMADFVKKNNLDGIDVDYEDLTAVSKGTAVAWVNTFQATLRKALPAGQFLISHAPLAPHFSPSFPATPKAAQGPYLQINKKVGSGIDFYNVQFYNDNKEYTDCNGLLTKSSAAFPKSSIFEVAASGVELNKLLIGKPIAAADAPSGGFMTPALIGTCAKQAKAKNWNAGVMGFEFTDAKGAASFIQPALASLGGAAATGDNSTSTDDPTVTATDSDSTDTATATDSDFATATDSATDADPTNSATVTDSATDADPTDSATATDSATDADPTDSATETDADPTDSASATEADPTDSASATDADPTDSASATEADPTDSASATEADPTDSASATDADPTDSASATDDGASATDSADSGAATPTEDPLAARRRMRRVPRRL